MNRQSLLRAIMLAWVILMTGSSWELSTPDVRQGVVMVMPMESQSMDALGPTWYYQYGYWGPEIEGHERMYMARPGYSQREVAGVMQAYPGRWWLVGNEPNDPFQDSLSPASFAVFYHDFSKFARRVDPGCRLAAGGIANASTGWAQAFLDAYERLYGRAPVVDAWSIHCYILEPDFGEMSVETFQSRMIGFHEWVTASREPDTPVFLTEYGVLDTEADTRSVAEYCTEVTVWLQETPVASHWAWFSSNANGEFGGDLMDFNGALTQCGEAYRDDTSGMHHPQLRWTFR